MKSALPHSPAAERNQQPILEALRQILPAQGTALEIASGTGQHAVWFAAHMPRWTWQPTDAWAEALPDIAARVAQEQLSNVRAPLQLDVMQALWLGSDGSPAPLFDAIYCANMLHVAPWPTCAALMQARSLGGRSF